MSVLPPRASQKEPVSPRLASEVTDSEMGFGFLRKEKLRLKVLCGSDRIFTLYSKSLPLDLACRIWDVFCRDGEEFLFRTALGILKLFEDILTKMDFIHIAQFLTRLPDDLPAEEFFASIAAVQMQSRNKKWAQEGRLVSRSGKPGFGGGERRGRSQTAEGEEPGSPASTLAPGGR
ncbi:hypothetical protein CB1_000159029 [Camelus ferus]|nr:hypothetical protein CB1_000159029 [Camelus ferus]